MFPIVHTRKNIQTTQLKRIPFRDEILFYCFSYQVYSAQYLERLLSAYSFSKLGFARLVLSASEEPLLVHISQEFSSKMNIAFIYLRFKWGAPSRPHVSGIHLKIGHRFYIFTFQVGTASEKQFTRWPFWTIPTFALKLKCFGVLPWNRNLSSPRVTLGLGGSICDLVPSQNPLGGGSATPSFVTVAPALRGLN